MTHDADRRRGPSPAERKAARGAVTDLAEVLDAAARLLEARQRSVAEIRLRLRALGYPADLIEAAVARLVELHYLDDDAFTRAWVASRDRARPRGEHALRTELVRKGVDRGTVDAVLDDRRAGAEEGDGAAGESVSADEAAAERLLTKRLSAVLREPDLRRRRQRAYALLARNGFAPDVCAVVTRRVLAGEQGGDAGADEGEDAG